MKISCISKMWEQAKACTPTLLFTALFCGSALAASAVQVTFQVNMEVQAATGNFNPSLHTVELRGSFDGWGSGITLSVSPTNASVYQGTVDITAAAGSTVQYKYVINQAPTLVWENDGVGPGGAQNREVIVPSSDQTLAVVHFNNQSTPPGVVAVTFQVNLQIQREIGNFDPEAHDPEVHGSFDNWSPAGVVLTPNPTNADIYETTINITGSAGTPYEYKFVINKPTGAEWEGNVGSGAFGNRIFNLAAGSSQMLPLVYFNNVTNNPGAGISVTFQANMVVQYVRGLFDPATGVVDVRGPFNSWGNPPYVLTNSPSNPYLFVGTITISNASPGNIVPYKFNMNGTWETGNDRSFVLASSSQTLPPRYFDDLGHHGSVSITPGPLPDEMTVSWTGYPHARLQSATDLVNPVWEDVPNTEGQSSTTVFFLAPDATFFRITGP